MSKLCNGGFHTTTGSEQRLSLASLTCRLVHAEHTRCEIYEINKGIKGLWPCSTCAAACFGFMFMFKLLLMSYDNFVGKAGLLSLAQPWVGGWGGRGGGM